jgi:hypothetical protein
MRALSVLISNSPERAIVRQTKYAAQCSHVRGAYKYTFGSLVSYPWHHSNNSVYDLGFGAAGL